MALSFSRPDPASPASVADAHFPTVRRGYDPDEVRDLLVKVAAELGRLHERERFLQHELRVAREEGSDAPATLDDETVVRLLGEETLRVLQTARESAAQIRSRAEEAAARMLREAADEADRIRTTAEADAARIRTDAAADAEAEVSLAKQQGREMVNEARAYREKVLTELARRRDAARQQIEQLASGRDRLVQAFERARLAAVDVIDGLSPLDEPDEYVNLAPTTGPVPLMVPRPSPTEAVAERHADTTPPAPERVAEESVAEEPVAEEPESEPIGAAEPEPEPREPDAVAAQPEPEVVDQAVEEPDPQPEAVDQAVEEPDPQPEVVDQAVEEPDPQPEVVDQAVEEPEPVAAAQVVDEPEPVAAAQVVEAPELGAPVPSARSNVVSIFARLRAETAPEGDAEQPDEAIVDAVPETPVEVAPETTADVVVEEPVDQVPVVVAARPVAPTTVVSPQVVAGEPGAFEQRDAALEPLVSAAARKLKRVLADEQNDVLGRLRQDEPVIELDDLVPEPREHASAYIDAIDTEIRAAAAAGAASLGADPDTDIDIDIDIDIERLAAVAELIFTGLVLPLRTRLHRAVIAVAGTGPRGSNTEVTRTVRAVYREWKLTHIDAHLADALRLAHGIGLLVAAVPGSPMCWTVDPSGPGCPDAEDNTLAGIVPAGEPYPTGHLTAPAHPGCRCLIAPTSN